MAQNHPQLYASLVKSKGYVVGSKLAASGLHRYDGNQTWTHLGWNTPRISAISYDPENADIIFLACGNGAVRTLDGGESWRVTTDWRVTETQDIAVDPNAPQHVYLATAYGVWRTKDRGETWTEASAGITKKYTQALKVDRTQGGRVLIGTEGGVYLSTDGAGSGGTLSVKSNTSLFSSGHFSRYFWSPNFPSSYLEKHHSMHCIFHLFSTLRLPSSLRNVTN
jgi:photosystem II stability/assembly factor-like uncharacterized protein